MLRGLFGGAESLSARLRTGKPRDLSTRVILLDRQAFHAPKFLEGENIP